MINTNIGSLRQSANLTTPDGDPQPDGDGNFTQAYRALDPPVWRCAIERAASKSALSHFSGTVLSQASHVLRGRFHSGITTKTVVSWTDYAGTVHTANVLDVDDSEGAGVESVVLVSEIVP